VTPGVKDGEATGKGRGQKPDLCSLVAPRGTILVMVTRDDELPADFLERIDPEAFSVSDLIGLVVARHGAPLSIEEITLRLAELGVFRSASSLRKTWSRLRCLRKRVDGKLEVIRESADFSEWDRLVHRVKEHLEPPEPSPAPPEPEKPPIDDTSPVDLEEVRRGLEAGLPAPVSLRRKLALLVEASGGRLTLDRAIELLGEAGREPAEERVRHALGGPVYLDENESLRHVQDHDSLVKARGLLRARLRELDEKAEHEKSWAESEARWDRDRRLEEEQKRAVYLAAKKAAIRCVFTRKGFAAASVLDPDRREFQDYTDAAELSFRLEECDIVFGLDPRADFERLGVRLPGEIVDLSPPVKTVGLNRRGRTLKVTPELIISSTLGISRPLGNRGKLREYVRKGSLAKLFRRLQSDLKALWRLYEYVCLHGLVRIHWGYFDEWRFTDWNVGGLPKLQDLLKEAKNTGEHLEIVFDTVPGWNDPWSRATRVQVIAEIREGWDRKYLVEVVPSGEQRVVYTEEVFAARLFPENPPHPESLPVGDAAAGEARAACEGGPPERAFTWPDERDDRVS
jgi:hypothetical protein